MKVMVIIHELNISSNSQGVFPLKRVLGSRGGGDTAIYGPYRYVPL